LVTRSENLSFSASSFGRRMSNVDTIGAVLSSPCLVEAIAFPSWENGAAANATEQWKDDAVMHYLSLGDVDDGWAGRVSTICETPNISIQRRAVNTFVTRLTSRSC